MSYTQIDRERKTQSGRSGGEEQRNSVPLSLDGLSNPGTLLSHSELAAEDWETLLETSVIWPSLLLYFLYFLTKQTTNRPQ
jgi:hypothetical protein